MMWSVLLFALLTIPAASAQVAVTFTEPMPEDVTVVTEGRPFLLRCNVTVEGGSVDITYQWEKDGELFQNGSVLSVPSANSNHTGVYVCVVRVEEGGGELGRSENVNVIVITADGSVDSAPLIAIVVCVTTITLIIASLICAAGLYLWCGRAGCTQCKCCCSCCWRQGRSRRPREMEQKQGIPLPSRSRLTSREKSKSSSLSHLLQPSADGFPLDTTLHKSSSNMLAGSIPTQATDLEDPHTLDFDLALDELMFEHGSAPASPQQSHFSNHKATPPLLHKDTAAQGRMAAKKESEQIETERRGSGEGTAASDEMETLRKSILKESKSFTEDLHNQRRGSAVSSDLSDIAQSDDNSLHLGKSVRFNVSEEDWGADSGVHTGTSTPHNLDSSQFERRSSEPETRSHRFSDSERRGSAPGDFVCRVGEEGSGGEEEEAEESREREREENSGEVDEGMATGSEEWGEREKSHETWAKKRFEGAFLQSTEEDTTDRETRKPAKPKHGSSGIATRVAQLFSASHTHNERKNIRGQSPLITSLNSSISKQKVLEMKEKFMQGGRGGGGGGGGEEMEEQQRKTRREEGRRPSLSKLVQERAEVFREKSSDESRDGITRTGSLKRVRRQEDISLDILEDHGMDSVHESKEETVATDEDDSMSPTSKKVEEESTKVVSNKATAVQEKEQPTTVEAPPVSIPIFSAPSGLSNWVPACLRETVISPYAVNNDTEPLMEDQDSDDSDGDDMLMEPLKPTTGRALFGVGPLSSMASLGGVASISPIGRSWLTSLGPAIAPLVDKPKTTGAHEKSFNESISSQRGHSARLAAIKRLSVIPEETPSACSSAIDINNVTTMS